MALELIAVVEGIGLPSFDFLSPAIPFDCSAYQLKLFNVSNETLTEGAQLQIQFATATTPFSEGPTCSGILQYLHANQGANEASLLKYEYQMREGVFIVLDNAEDPAFGACATLDIYSAGSIAGQPVHTAVHGLAQRSQGPMCHVMHGEYHAAPGRPITDIRVRYYKNLQGQWETLRGRAELWGYRHTASSSLYIPPAWQDYAPVVSPSSGAFASASAAGSWWTDGRVTQFEATATITSVGTGSGVLRITLPTTPYARDFYFPAGEHAVSGATCKGHVLPSSNLVELTKYDNTSIMQNGAVVSVSGSYRNA